MHIFRWMFIHVGVKKIGSKKSKSQFDFMLHNCYVKLPVLGTSRDDALRLLWYFLHNIITREDITNDFLRMSPNDHRCIYRGEHCNNGSIIWDRTTSWKSRHLQRGYMYVGTMVLFFGTELQIWKKNVMLHKMIWGYFACNDTHINLIQS